MSLKTFILSELYKGGIAYGLALARRFSDAGIVSWESVAPSSVYRALARLREEGLVARYGEGKRKRNRKFYAITARGKRFFERALSGELAEPRTYRNPLNIAVHCLRALPGPRAVGLLELRRADGRDAPAATISAQNLTETPSDNRPFNLTRACRRSQVSRDLLLTRWTRARPHAAVARAALSFIGFA